MNQTSTTPADDASSWLRREEIVERFEKQWRSAGEADLADFLPNDDPDKEQQLLTELVKVDLEYRWARGDEAHIERYLARFPQLGTLADAPLELLLEELHARGRCRRLPDSAELQRRFPGRVDQMQFCLDRLRQPTILERHVAPPESADTEPLPLFHSIPAPGVVELARTGLRQIGQYQIVEHVGRGGFATVYRALDQHLHREVAIKLPHAELIASGDARERLLREARAAAKLRHPAIVPIHEVGEHDGLPFIVFEFISGQTLAENLNATSPAPEQSAWWTLRIAEALDYAHRNGLVHRDVKPSNILISPPPHNPEPHERAGVPMLSDFGLALHLNADVTLTREGDLVGTPAYMSPEQARGSGHQVDARTDVYSLGVILYEMLAGRRPFEGSTASVLDQILRTEPPSPNQSQAGIPVDLETICLKALAKEPDRRYRSAAELADDLRSFLHHEPIRARRLSWVGRLRLWGRRNPTLAGTMAAAVIVIALVVGISYRQVIGDRDRFRVQRETARANLYQSLVGEARAIRLARSAGYQSEAWQRLKLASEVETPERNVLQLRNEAVASLGDFVGQPPVSWPTFGANNYAVAYALVPQSELVAVGLTNGEVTFRKLATGEEVARHKHGEAGVFGLAFSADGKRMATGDDQGGQHCLATRWRDMDQAARFQNGDPGAVGPRAGQHRAADSRWSAIVGLPDGSSGHHALEH